MIIEAQKIVAITLRLFCVTVITFCFWPCLHAQAGKADVDEFTAMSKRYTDHSQFVGELPVYPDKNGSWADINYDDTTKSNWQPAKHWERILWMAMVSRSGNTQVDHRLLMDHINQAMNFWFARNPVC